MCLEGTRQITQPTNQRKACTGSGKEDIVLWTSGQDEASPCEVQENQVGNTSINMFPVSLTQDYNLISNTMEPRMKEAMQTGTIFKNLSAVCLSEMIRTLFKHFSGRTLDPTEVSSFSDSVRFLNKMISSIN